MHVVSLTDALRYRTALILEALAERTPENSNNSMSNAFKGYRASEGLEGELTVFQDKYMILYKRPGDTGYARVRLYNINMISVKEVDKSEPTVVESNVEQRKILDIDLPPGVVDEKTVGDELGETISFGDAAKKAWGVAAKASLSAEYAGIKGALEVSGNYGEDYTRHHDESRYKKHYESDKLTITGPTKFKLEAYRSSNRESRVITARCDFDHTVWIDDPSCWGTITFDSFKSHFLPIVRRIAPNNIEYYHEFMQNQMSDEQIEELEQSSGKIVQFVVEYDNVLIESLKRID